MASLFFSCVFPPAAFALGIEIDSSGSIDMDGGIVSMDCGDIVIDGELSLGAATISGAQHVDINGSLNGGSGSIELAGDWSNAGTFAPGASTIEVTDGCGIGTSNFSGDTAFFNLRVATATGKQLNLPANSTQSIANRLALTGVAGNLLSIRSSTFGAPAFLELDAGGGQFISYVDVQDNHAPVPGQILAPGPPLQFNSVDSGGNDRWFISLGVILLDSFEDFLRGDQE